MKALILEGEQTLRFGDAPDPHPLHGEVLVRIAASGICGSDIEAYLGRDARRPAPLILGHEAAGTIVGGAHDDARVTLNPLVTCLECTFCKSGRTNLCEHRQIISMPPRHGAFAQLVALPERNVVVLPDDVPLNMAALTEPMACGWHVARLCRRAYPRGRNALVIGGGTIGLACALGLAAQGVTDVRIVEANPLRAAYLRDVCDQPVVAEGDLPEGDVFDIVIDAVGSTASRALGSNVVQRGGVLGHIGLGDDLGGLEMRRITLHEVTVIGAYTYTAQDFRDTAAAMFDGRLGALDWVETRPLSEGAQAFEDIHAGRVAAPKTLLVP
jgi:L-iditol 2-dehydrogenase